MRLSEILKEDARHVWSITFKDQWTDEGDEDLPDIERWEFDVRHNGKVVGSVGYDNYFGNIRADFGARSVELSNYVNQYVDDPEQVTIQAIGNYFNSPTGKKHFEIMARQKGLQPQPIEKKDLDEIKVTKTVAGKKQTPSRNLAMDQKKKSPKQGKKPVELDKSAKSMKDLSNEILKGEYTHTRDFGK